MYLLFVLSFSGRVWYGRLLHRCPADGGSVQEERVPGDRATVCSIFRVVGVTVALVTATVEGM